MRPRPTTDYPGIGAGLLAAACWASYILLNRTVGQRVPGAQGSAAAAGISAVAFLPVGVMVGHNPAPGALLHAIAAGVMSSAVPFGAGLFTLRRVPARAFGLFTSVKPVLAAAVGAVLLDQRLGATEWLSIAAIVAANVVSILTQRRSVAPPGRAIADALPQTSAAVTRTGR